MNNAESEPHVAGGSFLTCDHPSFATPEQLSPEARLMAKTMEDFVRKEVLPVNDRLQRHEAGLMHSLLGKAGALGLLAGTSPERYGGLELPKTEAAHLAERAGIELSWAISSNVQSGIALYPVLLFGTEEQRALYVPGIASGEKIAAFALSEANSGSDALGAQSRAVAVRDGYVLNGSKMWITNAAFADVFTVFAQLEGHGFTAFLMDRDSPGLTVEKEEHKLGLHGSSTCRLTLENVRVPSAGLLGEPGKGYRPALHALNYGRLNIGVISLGASKEALRIATQYAKERKQFGQSLASFGMIQYKLAEMAIRILALESMIYRTAGLMEGAASDEFAIECAIVKFIGSETLDYVVDEAVQIHGGFGYSEEFAVARMYRDARVFRIFEGTNEINRLTVTEQLARRASAGRIPLFEAVESGVAGAGWADALRASAFAAILANRPAWPKLAAEQEVCGAIADLVGLTYAVQSMGARSRGSDLMRAGFEAFASSALDSAVGLARFAGAEAVAGPRADGAALRREVAAAVLDRSGYPW